MISSLKKYSTTVMGHNTHICLQSLEKTSIVDSNPTGPNKILLFLPQLDTETTLSSLSTYTDRYIVLILILLSFEVAE